MLGAVLGACGDDDRPAEAAFSAEEPGKVVALITTAVSVAGGGMASSTALNLARTPGAIRTADFSASSCDEYGQPKDMYQDNPAFPGTHTYCRLSVDDGSPETVQGSFSLIKKIACQIEKGGVVYDGSTKAITLAAGDCFSAEDMEDMGGGALDVNVVGSSPASFNSYFERGLVITVAMGEETMVYQLGTKVSGDSIEFASYETQGAGRSGAYSASLDLKTGLLRVENRTDRLTASCGDSCGFNKHMRVYATLNMVNNEPKDLLGLEFADASLNGGDQKSGSLVTAKGDMTSGIKARFFGATNGSMGQVTDESQFGTAANWVENTNTKCYTKTADDAATCGAGIDKFSSSTGFLLYGTYTASATYFANYAGMKFTSIDLNSEAP